MTKAPLFATIGKATDSINVLLSYRIIELFSEGLYASPNKAIEELATNSFDAGAYKVQVLLSPNLHDQAATIVVIDDGESMDAEGLKQHWLIGVSNKRDITKLPAGRSQIGKFGIGKLATYVLANRLTHVCKKNGKYYSTSMDFNAIDKTGTKEVGPKAPIKIPLLQLSESEAKKVVKEWTDTKAFKKSNFRLFGKGSSPSWTFAIMSNLKPKVHEIKPGFLEWVLKSALPLRPDFEMWLNDNKLVSSKQDKGLIQTWILGKDIVKLPKPAPKDITISIDKNAGKSSEKKFGLYVQGLGRITGYAEAYEDLLTGKSDQVGRSHGFFVYVLDRLINVIDGHFGIPPDELRHGTFGRFRLVIHIDGLDAALRSNRETISDGPLLSTTQDVLRAIFNYVRPIIEKREEDEQPGVKLARKLAASPKSFSRYPIVELTRDVLSGKTKSRYLLIPDLTSKEEKAAFIDGLEKRASNADQFITGVVIDYNGSAEEGIAKYDTVTGHLNINAWHPFIATFQEEFSTKGISQPLEIFALADVLAEAHLYITGVKSDQIEDFLSMRDQLLRNLANESGYESAFAVAQSLLEARNNPNGLEDKICVAFRSLGFEARHIGGPKEPDGLAVALLAADEQGPHQYGVSLEGKSKKKDIGKVAAKTVGIADVIRHRDKYNCEHALVVGRDFPTKAGDASALASSIEDDRKKTLALNQPRTITLITIDSLAKLVKLRPIKQIGLKKIKSLFIECKLPGESAKWVEDIEAIPIVKPPYTKIILAIEAHQKKFVKSAVTYSALQVALSYLNPPIHYETDEEIKDLCKGMAQMAPKLMYATDRTVELDTSAKNVIAAIEAFTKDYDYIKV